ncbi:MAG: trypsin-like peptidase domain-containing protein [Pirellulales bacterium]|nr:trypsin-like peptidase domain-containing protein [Pirellulales bacterium]
MDETLFDLPQAPLQVSERATLVHSSVEMLGGGTPQTTTPIQSSASSQASEGSNAVVASSAKASGSQFAVSSGLLWLMLFGLLALLAGPIVVGRFVYEMRYNELKAGYDISSTTLTQVKSRLNDLELASRLVAKRAEPSVVSITRPSGRNLDGQGSGVIVDKSGYIVTNFHVVNGMNKVQVRLSDRRVAEAKVVGTDAMNDIAVLKIELDNLIPAEWGNSDRLEVGDLVWALGSPYGLERSLTFGIISAKARRSSSYVSRSPYQEYLQTDAAVNPGNSGGPLVNIEGQVVGINAAIFGTAYQGISFSIPSSIARARYEELKAKGHIDRAWLGILPLDVPEDLRARFGLELGEGVLVGTVERGAPAGRVGVQPGDIILKWNDHVASDPTLLSRTIAATDIGSTAKLVLVRYTGKNKEQLAFDVKVERRPQDEDER